MDKISEYLLSSGLMQPAATNSCIEKLSNSSILNFVSSLLSDAAYILVKWLNIAKTPLQYVLHFNNSVFFNFDGSITPLLFSLNLSSFISNSPK